MAPEVQWPLQWPPEVAECTRPPFRFSVPEPWFASIPNAASGQQCIFSGLTEVLTPVDRPAADHPGFYRSGIMELDGFAIAIAEMSPPTDLAGAAASYIKSYVGEDVQVTFEQGIVRIDPPLDGVVVNALTNGAGLVALQLRVVVRVQHEFGGSPAAGTTTAPILVALPQGTIAAISHKPMQYSKQSLDDLVPVMMAVFASLQPG
jgi:hypothetical protein